MTNIKLIVGLGNPGPEYEHTRHNVGAWLVEALAAQQAHPLRSEAKFRGRFCSFQLSQAKCYALIPTTYMNESGQAVSAVARFYKLSPQEILVAHDELDFPAGTVRLKHAGGHGGHNGLRDIIAHLHTADFYRLRLGIGHPGHKDKVTPHVLGRPSHQDGQRIEQAIQTSLNLLPDIISGDLNKAQQLLHN